MKDSKHLNSISKDHIVQSREDIPSDYHCTCEYCKNFMGDIFNTDESKYYSNRIRKGYYKDGAGDHLDVGQIIGYRWAIQNLMPENGWLLDPTVGSGTAIVEALNNRRNAIGVELEYPEIARTNIEHQNVSEYSHYFRQGNALKIKDYMQEWGLSGEFLDLIINGTPYPKMGGKSSDSPERKNLKTGEDKSFDYYDPENIGTFKGNEYWDLVKNMYSDSLKYLKPGGYFVILIKDLVQNKVPYLLHKHIIDIVLSNNKEMEHYGFFLHSHAPTTMYQNTYNKRFPDLPIPWYQVGIVLRKKGGNTEGFPVDKSNTIRKTPYKLFDPNDEITKGITVDLRSQSNKMIWEKDGVVIDNPLIMRNNITQKNVKKNNKEIKSEYKEGYKQSLIDSIKILTEKLNSI